jgi:DNA primase
VKADVGKVLAKLGIAYRQQGNELHALCPAHEDRKPSWSINVATGQHHCFSCGWGGGIATLVQRVRGLEGLIWNTGDAWDWMRANGLLLGDGERSLDLELTLRMPSTRPFVLPTLIGAGQLTLWPTPAVRYAHERRIPGWQIKRYGIGVAIDGRLANRVVFPVRDSQGNEISYSARSFVGAQPRYLTPQETENPKQGALFGEQYWPAPGSRTRIVVVEGAIKALAVERAAGCAVAGILGASQAKHPIVAAKLATFREVTVLLDNDEAGETNAETLLGALRRHTTVKRARMPGKLAADDATPTDVMRALA